MVYRARCQLHARVIWLLLVLPLMLVSARCSWLKPQNTAVSCIHNLEKASKVFNEASESLFPGAEMTSSSSEKYQQVVHLLDQNVLPCLKQDDLKVNAYALLAFSRWSLRNYMEAIDAAEKGRGIYERAAISTNIRDYGMLLIVPGLVLHSQTHKQYKDRREQGFISVEEAEQFTQQMLRALDEINGINIRLPKNEPIVIYANYQQLLVISDIIDLWSKGVKDRQDWAPQVNRWIGRADDVAAKFPADDYAGKESVQKLLARFDNARRSLGSS